MRQHIHGRRDFLKMMTAVAAGLPAVAAARTNTGTAYDPAAKFEIDVSEVEFRRNPWDTIHEGNPQEILDRREPVALVPMLIMQGALDDNVRPAVQEKFAATYKAAGGDCQLHVFEDSEHEWVAKPGPQTDRAREMVKAFIARQMR